MAFMVALPTGPKSLSVKSPPIVCVVAKKMKSGVVNLYALNLLLDFDIQAAEAGVVEDVEIVGAGSLSRLLDWRVLTGIVTRVSEITELGASLC